MTNYGASAAFGRMSYEEAPLMKNVRNPDTKRRQRMNLASLVQTILIPWFIFSIVAWALSFELHWQRPVLCYWVVAGFLLLVLGCGFSSLNSRKELFPAQAPSWIHLFFITSALAWTGGVVVGTFNFYTYVKPERELEMLNTYVDVDPTQMRGQQLMDASVVQFTKGTWIDVAKSMGFKNKVMYCVAPISFGNTTLATYDFWAVGTNCCDGNQPSFKCVDPDAARAEGRGAVRIFSEKQRGFYRLAVQQAEATFGIKASHPLFFGWVGDVVAQEQSWRTASQNLFFFAIAIALVIQASIVITACLGFARISQ